MTKHITVGNVRFLVTDDLDEGDTESMEALRALAAHIESKAADMLPPEMEERQREARERIVARNQRLRGEGDA